MRICGSLYVLYYIYGVYMSPIDGHRLSRVHAHLHACFVLSVYTCRRMSVCGVCICACTRVWGLSRVCNICAIYIHYRGRDEPQMRMHMRICIPYTNRRVRRECTCVRARVHAHMRFHSCHILHYRPPIYRSGAACDLRVRMRICASIVCCFFRVFSTYAELRAC